MRLARVTAVLLALLGASVAVAQTEMTDEQKQAVQAFRKAQQREKDGQVKEAAAAYREALKQIEVAFGKDHPNVAAVLDNLARLHGAGGEHEKAEPLLRRSLEIYEGRFGKEHLHVAFSLSNLAALYQATGRYARAEPLFKRSLDIVEANHGKDHPEVATALNDLATLYWTTGEHAKAEPLYERSLAIREARFGKDHPAVAQSLNNLANCYRAMGRYAKAEPLFKRSLAIWEARPDRDSANVALALNNLAGLYRDVAEYARAERLYERSLKIREASLGKNHPSVASSLNNLATLYWAMGEYAKAESRYQRSLEVLEATLGKGHPWVATTRDNLANLYRITGQYAKAGRLFERSLGDRVARLGKGHPDVAISLNNLASLYQDVGQYTKAEPLFKRSLEIREAKLGRNHPDVAESLNNLAGLYKVLGQPEKAEPLYRRSLTVFEANLGKDHPAVATALNNLALLYERAEQYAMAKPLYERSLAIRELRLGKDHPDVAISLNNLALLYQDVGQHAKAEPLFKRGLAIWEARLGKDHPNVATTLNNLAGLYRDVGKHSSSERLYRRSLAIREASLGKDHPDVALSLNNLALLLAEQDRTREAGDLTHRARQTSRRHVGLVLPSLPQYEQAAFLAVSERRDLARALSLGVLLADAAEERARSAEWLLNGKALGQEALAQSSLLSRDSKDPATRALAERLRQARTQLARLALALAPAGKEKEHRERVEQLVRQERDLAGRLAASGGASVLAADWVKLDGVRRALPAGGVLIDVARFDVYDFKGAAGKSWKPARYVAWLTFTGGDVRVTDLGEAARIDAAVKAVRQALESSPKFIKEKGEAEAERALREPLEALSKLVLRPLLPHVGQSKQWVVSPDGNLWLVPWETLLLKDGRYAVERHQVRYVLSGRDLLPAIPYKGKVQRPLVLADPDFDLDAGTARAETARLLGERGEQEELRSLSGSLRLGDARRLPGTLAEARAIEKTLAGYAKAEPRVLTGRSALEAVVKHVRGPRVLVLSTHGFFLPAQQFKPSERTGERAASLPGWENPLIRSGLLLAGCNQAGKAAGSDDGVLTGLEVAGLDLRGTDLVVLSACETGLGDVRNGEGVAGLRQAFQLAGAKSVLSSLWGVPDLSSAELMARFFAHLSQGKDRAEALRQAQLELIAQRREDFAAAHPLFWAAFTLTSPGK